MSRTLAAFVLSFLIYLVPILHAHGGTFLGLYLWAALAEGSRAEEPLWLALDIGVAIALQAGWFMALRWILSGSRLRWLLLAALAPATAVAAVWAYLAVIPIMFLIEMVLVLWARQPIGAREGDGKPPAAKQSRFTKRPRIGPEIPQEPVVANAPKRNRFVKR